MLEIRNAHCKDQASPAVVNSDKPRFSWQLESDTADCWQAAYRIVVYDGGAALWDSGTVESAESADIAYDGPPLISAREYGWKVSVRDNHGEAAESEIQRFFTGLARWDAKWIEPDPLPQLPVNPLTVAAKNWQDFFAAFLRGERTDFLTDTDIQTALEPEPYDPAVLLRRSFDLTGTVKHARLYITAHGIYRAKLNGRDVTNTQLDPGFTTYDLRLKYQIFDVAKLLRGGENQIEIEIADGWYKGKIALGRGCEYGEIPGALMELHIETEDGVQRILSDEGFTYTFGGPIRMADLYLGQTTDARFDPDKAEWKPVVTKPVDESVLEAQEHPGVVVFKEIPAKELLTTPNGETVVDFGQNMAGHIRVKLSGSAGDTFTFEHGETMGPDGNFFYIWNSDPTRAQRDTYICDGTGEEIFEPIHTYHGFRYVRVKGGANWKPEQFTAMAISSDNIVAGGFVCSDPKLNQLESNISWSQRSNMIGIPTDCPTREKAGWTGDVFIHGPTSLWHQDLTAFYRDWLKSLRMEQLPNGGVQNTVPLIKNYVQQVGMTSMGWGDVILTLPWQLYTLCGDKAALTDNYSAMERWMVRVVEMTEDVSGIDMSGMTERQKDNQRYLINTGFHFGDWLIPSIRNDAGFSDGPMSSVLTMKTTCSAIAAYSGDLFAEISRVLGKMDNEAKYRAWAKRVREAFAEEMCTPEGLLYQELQGNYVVALQYRMVPKDKRPVLLKRLKELIVENDYKLDTGFMSIPWLLDVLYENGEKETAWKMLTQNQCPGWMFEVEHGATTMWESWDAKRADGTVSDQSFNHYAFGCVGDYVYRRVLGIQNAGHGYDKVRLCPDYDCPLEFVSGWHDGVHGKIKLKWLRENGTFHITGKLPPNTSGVLVLPDGSETELKNGKFDLHVAEVSK